MVIEFESLSKRMDGTAENGWNGREWKEETKFPIITKNRRESRRF